jgi:hypothetical protein
LTAIADMQLHVALVQISAEAIVAQAGFSTLHQLRDVLDAHDLLRSRASEHSAQVATAAAHIEHPRILERDVGRQSAREQRMHVRRTDCRVVPDGRGCVGVGVVRWAQIVCSVRRFEGGDDRGHGEQLGAHQVCDEAGVAA